MTDLESPKKNNDCYFYYYSTCSKGDSCGFRHEPSALGCETICSFWKEGKCLNVHCNFRHMELRKNRKAIPCYWESQPGGCLKPHCPFLHQNPRPPLPEDDGKSSTYKSETNLTENCNQAGNFKTTPSVDSLVVNFEEESDNESAPTTSPAKSGTPKVKTLEEIKLEKIAAACAAYYSYPSVENIEDKNQSEHSEQPQTLSGDDLRQRILQRVKTKDLSQRTNRKLSRNELAHILGDDSLKLSDNTRIDNDLPSVLDSFAQYKRRKITEKESIEDIRIKSLDEIRAERHAQKTMININSEEVQTKKRRHSPIRLARKKIFKTNETADISQKIIDEAEVSSTSNDEPEPRSSQDGELELQHESEKVGSKPLKPLRKLNLKKLKLFKEEANQYENISSNSKNIEKEDILQHGQQEEITPSIALLDSKTSNDNINRISSDEYITTKSDNIDKTAQNRSDSEKETQALAPSATLESSKTNSDNDTLMIEDKKKDLDRGYIEKPKLERSDSDKTLDESVLLLDDSEVDINVNLKAEDDLLNEIDDLLNE